MIEEIEDCVSCDLLNPVSMYFPSEESSEASCSYAVQ